MIFHPPTHIGTVPRPFPPHEGTHHEQADAAVPDPPRWIQDKHEDETGAETIEIILGVLAAVVLAALVWAGINTFATNRVGELG